ncbi:MAG: methyl-accepting chemotaxis protein, partial [Bacillota bacterium]|nr:methyl-accepting chemotaxis protein [Bacillota bacterium]
MNIKFFKGLFSKIKAAGKKKTQKKVSKASIRSQKDKRASFMSSVNLKVKLYVSFAILIAFMLATSAISLTNIRKINVQAQGMYEKNLKSINILNNMREIIFTDINTAHDLSGSITDTNVQKLESSTKAMDELLKQFQTEADTKVNKNLLTQLASNDNTYKDKKGTFIDYCKKNYDNLYIYDAMLKNSGNDMNVVLDSLIKYNEDQADIASKNNLEVYNSTLRTSVSMLAVTILLSLLIAAAISTNIASQVRKILAFANVLKNKDLSIDIQVNGRDEFSKISRALLETKESIKNIIGNVADMSQDMGASSEELSATIQEITSKMDEIDSNTLTIVKDTEDLSALTEEVTASTLESNTTINKLSEKSQLGNKISRDIEKRAMEIKEKTDESLRASDELYRINQTKIVEAI